MQNIPIYQLLATSGGRHLKNLTQTGRFIFPIDKSKYTIVEQTDTFPIYMLISNIKIFFIIFNYTYTMLSWSDILCFNLIKFTHKECYNFQIIIYSLREKKKPQKNQLSS